MFTAAELLPLIEAIYAGILDQAAWEAAITRLCRAFDGEAALLILRDAGKAERSRIAFVAIDRKFRESYSELIWLPDMSSYFRTIALHANRTALTGEELVLTTPGFEHSRFYNEWLQAQKLGDYLAAPLAPRRSVAGGVYVGRSNRNGGARYGKEELDGFRALQPHLLRACQARLRLEDAQDHAVGALAALDRIEQGVILVDAQAAIVHANRAGDGMLTRNDGLVARRSVLACDHADDTARLRRAIGAASARRTEGPDAALAVRRRSGRRPLSVLVAPLRTGEPRGSGRGATAMVLVSDPEARVAAPADGLRTAYGLTAAEARTVAALLDHGHLAEVAAALGVSLATVRTLLQRAFDKTGTHSQAELVRLMLAHRLPAGPASGS